MSNNTFEGALRLQEQYRKQIRPALQKQFDLQNIMQAPEIEKIVVNVGVKEAVADTKHLDLVKQVLQAITGQKPMETKARNSIAGFKLREGMPIGAKVTLRHASMYVFLDKLINAALPKVRDFQGVSVRLDGRGNYNLGIKEWNIFPEAEAAGGGEKLYGLNITIHMSTNSDSHAFELLKQFGMPFKRQK